MQFYGTCFLAVWTTPMQYCSNLAFVRNFLGRYGGSVASMSIALPRLGSGIKVTPIRTCLEPSICPASWRKAIWAKAVRAQGIHVSHNIIDRDGSSILAHKVRSGLAGVWAPWNTTIGAPNPSVLFHRVISLTFALKQTARQHDIQHLYYIGMLVLLITLFGLHREKKVVGSKGNRTTVLSWQRHRLILPLGHKANRAAKSGGIVFLSVVGVSLQ